jgi:GNAT superfamily N-acetyltransferase
VTIEIRRIRPDDALAARDLRLRALATDPLSFGSNFDLEVARPDAFWLEAAADRASSPDRANFLAVDGGSLVGVAVTARDRERLEVFAVYSVWIVPAFRGQGIGVRLLTALEEFAAAHGGARMELTVTDASPAARRLYERMGFVADGRIQPSPHAGVVEHGMVKLLC